MASGGTILTGGMVGAFVATQAWVACAQVVPANVPYFNDFAVAPAANREWSSVDVTSSPSQGQILGRFLNDPVTLTVQTTPGVSYDLFFDLWCIDSWDSDHPVWGGPDVFTLVIAGQVRFNANIGWINDSHFDWPELRDQDFGLGVPNFADRLYRRINYSFVATGSTTQIVFDASGLQGIDDESWGLDNVRVVETINAPPLRFAYREIGAQNQTQWGNVGGWPASVPSVPALWADMNNDGHLDTLQGGNSNTAVLMRHEGNFTNRTISGAAQGLQVMDFDNDGGLELWRTPNGWDFSGLRNHGGTWNGQWVALSSQASTIAGMSGVRAMAALDADRDGWCDLVLLGPGANAIAFNAGQSAGQTHAGFQVETAAMPQDATNRGNGAWMATGDVNNDGIPDIFYTYNGGRLFLSNGTGGFEAAERGISVSVSANSPAGASFADFDNDGDLDLFVGRRGDSNPSTLWRNNAGSFTNIAGTSQFPQVMNVVSGTWGDYDNDGDLDLAFTRHEGFAGIARNNGSASGWSFTLEEEGIATMSRGADIVFADFDNDGDLDLSFTSEHQHHYSRHWENLLNNGHRSLRVRVLGRGERGINKAGVGARVELWNADNSVFLQRRDLGAAQGSNGMTQLWAHFGGLADSATYTLRLYRGSSYVSTTVVPATATTTIGPNTLSRFFTLDESLLGPIINVVRWREVGPDE